MDSSKPGTVVHLLLTFSPSLQLDGWQGLGSCQKNGYCLSSSGGRSQARSAWGRFSLQVCLLPTPVPSSRANTNGEAHLLGIRELPGMTDGSEDRMHMEAHVGLSSGSPQSGMELGPLCRSQGGETGGTGAE